MKGKTFSILLVVAVVLGGLAFLRFSDRDKSIDTRMGQKLFADLPVNQVASIAIAGPDSSVTLVKGDNVWQVKERHGYPADFGELRDMVVKLSRLKIGRAFSGSGDSLARLSLLAPSTAEEKSRGTQMTLKDGSGKVLADVILGETRKTEGGGSGGQYLKKTDNDTVYLVDGSFRLLKTKPTDWLQDKVLDIKGDDIQSVTCYAGDDSKPVYTLARSEKGRLPELSPLPEGRTIDSSKVDQVFDALAPLTLDDVTPADKAVAAAASRLVYRLYDGRQITVSPTSDGEEIYRVRVAAEEGEAMPEAVDDKAVETADKAKETETTSAEAAPAEKKEDAPVVKTAQQINDELGPWVFSIKKWQFDSFIANPEGFLEVIKKESEAKS